MPPLIKFKKEDIVNIAYKIVKYEGLEGLNARRIAKNLNSSIQPIFHNFKSMDELKNSVVEKIYHTYLEYMKKGSSEENAYKGMGIYYIKFAKDYPNFFKILFMTESKLSPYNFILNDDAGNDVIKNGQVFSGLDYEEQKKFHLKVWIFTHGIAAMVASNTVEFTDEEIDDLLGKTVREMLIGYKRENRRKDEKSN